MSAGIYFIRNLINNKVYIGSTEDFRSRWKRHKTGLRGNRHHCEHLQNAWNKYGADAFAFEIIEQIDLCEDGTDTARLEAAEQVYLDRHWDNNINCYNVNRFARGGGHPCSDETKIILRERALDNLHKSHAPEVNERRRQALQGKPLSQERKDKIGKSNKGKKRTAAHKAAVSRAQKGQKRVERIKKVCACGCGKEFEVLPHKVDQQYIAGHHMKNKVPHNKSKTKYLPQQRECAYCGVGYIAIAKNGRYSQFCSLSCRGKNNVKRSSKNA